MSQLNIYGEKLLQVLNQNFLNESAIREIENNALLRKGSSFLDSIKDVLRGRGSLLINSGLSNDTLFEVSGDKLKSALDNSDEQMEVTVLDSTGNGSYNTYMTVDIIMDSIADEIEVANLTNNVLAVITSISDNSDYSTVANGLRAACSNAVTSAGAAFSEYVNRALLATSSPFELRKLMVQSIFPEPSSGGFQVPTIGSVTGTSGLSLWFHSGIEKVTAAIESLKLDFTGVISRAYNKYVDNQTSNASLMVTGWKILSYNFSKWFSDPLVLPVKNFTHLALNNSFIDLGLASDALISAIENTMGDSLAVAIPTIGATWYVYKSTSDTKWHVGMQKHLYDYTAAHKLYTLASQTSNTFRDVFSCYSTTGYNLEVMDAGGQFYSVGQFNQYIYQSFRETEKIITLGLLLLQSDDEIIKNLYYQDTEDTARTDTIYRWTNVYNGSAIGSDPNENTRKGLALASNNTASGVNNIDFACSMLRNYFLGLENNKGVCQHLYINGPLPGYMNVADDALTMDQVSTRITNIAIAAAVFTSLILSAKAIRSIRMLALDAQINAQRLILDSTTPVSTARNAIIKATRLSKLSGSVTSFTTGIATSGLTSSGPVFENKEVLNSSLEDIRRLIAG